MMTKYKFRREDDGVVVEVGFEVAILQDRAGFITLEDGVKARRVNTFQAKQVYCAPNNATSTPPPSDNLGFTVHQLAEFEHDRVRNGFVGIEFKQDPRCDTFYQVHFSSHKAREEYIRHRGKVDMNKTIGASLSPQLLLEAEKMVKKRWN